MGFSFNKKAKDNTDCIIFDNITDNNYFAFVLEYRYNDKYIKLLKRLLSDKNINSYILLDGTGVSKREFDNQKQVVNFMVKNNSGWLDLLNKKFGKPTAIIPFGRILNQIIKSTDLDISDDFLIPYYQSCFYLGDRFLGDYNTHIFPVYSLSNILYQVEEGSLMGDLLTDTWYCNHFRDVLSRLNNEREYYTPDLSDYEIKSIDTKRDFVKLCMEKMGSDFISFDLETSGFNFLKDRIGCLTLSFDGVVGYYIDWNLVDVSILSKLMLSCKKRIAVNGKFDLKFLWKNGLSKEVHLTDDVMLLSHTINTMGHSGLKSNALLYTPYGGYDDVLDSYKERYKIKDYTKIPKEILMPYATIDAILPIRIYKELVRKVTDFDSKEKYTLKNESKIEYWDTMRWYNEITMPLAKEVTLIEYNGVCVDKDWLYKNRDYLTSEMKKTEIKLRNRLTNEWKNLNIFSTKELCNYFKKNNYPLPEGSSEYNSSEDTLFDYEKKASSNENIDLEFIQDLKYIRSINTALNSFLGTPAKKTYDKKTLGEIVKKTGWEKYLEKHDDDTLRIHPSYSITGAKTLRMKCREPNLQNIPSHTVCSKYVKQCIGVPTATMYHLEENGFTFDCIETDFVNIVGKGYVQVINLTEEDIIDTSDLDKVVKTYDEFYPIKGIVPTTYKDILEEKKCQQL